MNAWIAWALVVDLAVLAWLIAGSALDWLNRRWDER